MYITQEVKGILPSYGSRNTTHRGGGLKWYSKAVDVYPCQNCIIHDHIIIFSFWRGVYQVIERFKRLTYRSWVNQQREGLLFFVVEWLRSPAIWEKWPVHILAQCQLLDRHWSGPTCLSPDVDLYPIALNHFAVDGRNACWWLEFDTLTRIEQDKEGSYASSVKPIDDWCTCLFCFLQDTHQTTIESNGYTTILTVIFLYTFTLILSRCDRAIFFKTTNLLV